MSGLHTLVDGLTLNSPDASSPPAYIHHQPPPSMPMNPATTSHASNNNTVHGSIFNNPNPTSGSSSPRLQVFGSRRISYGRSPSCSATANTVALAPSSSSSSLNSHRASSSDAGVTKEVDDPSTPGSGTREYSTSTKMFLSPTTPTARYPAKQTTTWRGSDTLKLDDFIYTRGFLEGACSDITITAFGTRYPLHRLILDRSPFFSSCFNGGPWAESNSSEISITPELSDPNITQHAFELALARLYGHCDPVEEDEHALPLLAAASFLDLQDLAESCVNSLLRNLKTSNISKVLRFVTNSFYGHLTDRLLDSAKAMLYRDGWEMDMTEWDGISGEMAAEVIGFDGFYVPDERLRYCFVKEMIDWRIKKYLEAERNKDGEESEDGTLDEEEADIKPLRELLETGIYYMHMSFEELQKIMEDKDVLGRPVVPREIIQDALWNQMLLRQKVTNAPLLSPELGITERYVPESDSMKRMDTPPCSEKSMSPSSRTVSPDDLRVIRSPASNYLDEPGASMKKAPRKYFIPTEDSTIVIGDHMALPEQTTAALSLPNHGRNGRPLSHNQECSVGAISGNGNSTLMMDKDLPYSPREDLRYSVFPPFRFSAEFRNVRALKEKRRVYSQTVFYAGSHWNIYIQKVKSPKNVQLGVYLHRAKDRESALNIAATGYAHGQPGSLATDSTMLVGHVEIDGTTTTTTATASSMRTGSRPPIGGDFDTGDETLNDPSMGRTHSTLGSSARASLEGSRITSDIGLSQPHVPAIDFYTDARPQVQTYFKIFSPSKKGKVLSMFSSHPDSFNFSQSWGWKSSSLILDESLIGESDKESRLRFMVVLGNV